VRKLRIFITVTKKGEKITLEIQDNAGGIPKEIVEKIFDPYFSTKQDRNGTGLGLYMSKMIIEEKLYGSLRVKNRDEGACFIISLRDEVEKNA